MTSTQSDLEPLIELFEHLADSILKEASLQPQSRDIEDRLWRLPKHVVHYYYNTIRDADQVKVRPLVRMLRSRAVDLICSRPEYASIRQARAERIAALTEQFRFRPWRMGDVDRFMSYLDNPAMWAYIPEDYPAPLTRDLAEVLIRHSNAAPERHEVRAVEWQGQVIGQVRLQFDSSPESDGAEVSYWLAQPFWNQGLTTDFVTLYTSTCFANHPRLAYVFAQVLDGNDASLRVLQKSGYRWEAFAYRNQVKRGKPTSTHVLSVFRQDYHSRGKQATELLPAYSSQVQRSGAGNRREIAW